MIVGIIWRKPVLTHASIVCEGMLASVNSVKNGGAAYFKVFNGCQLHYHTRTSLILVKIIFVKPKTILVVFCLSGVYRNDNVIGQFVQTADTIAFQC